MISTLAVSASPRKRRWFPRFGLRTLLILVTLFGAGFGYLGHLYRRVHHQRQIVVKIEEAGGAVRYDWQLILNRDAISPAYTKTPPGPALLRLGLGHDAFAYVEEVDFTRYSHPTEPFDPRLLLELPHLRQLWLVGTQVNDQWLATVAKIPDLHVLVLSGGPQSTEISDASLASIARLTRLEYLVLDHTLLTKQAAEELQKSLPNCRISGEDKDGAFVLTPN
jgi:hypothetical protein